MIRLPYLLCLCLCLPSCDTGTKIDSRKVAQEMRSRKVVHATAVQLTEAAFGEGAQLARLLDGRLVQALRQAPDTTRLLSWAARCSPRTIGADSLAATGQVAIRRMALRTDGRRLGLSAKAFEVWDAYRYNLENGLALEPNVQRDGTAHLLYSQAIGASDGVCLRCHGTIGRHLTSTEFGILKKAYPAIDSLVGHGLNQPIGIWNFLYLKNGLLGRIPKK